MVDLPIRPGAGKLAVSSVPAPRTTSETQSPLNQSTSAFGKNNPIPDQLNYPPAPCVWKLINSFFSRFRGFLHRWLPPLPLALILAVLMGGTQGLLGLLAWHFPYSTGNSLATSLANDVQFGLLNLAVTRLQTHIKNAEHLVNLQRTLWATGVYSDASIQAKNVTLQSMLDTIVTHRDVFALYAYTTPLGGYNGYSVSIPRGTHTYEYTQFTTNPQSVFSQARINPDTPLIPIGTPTTTSGYNATNQPWVSLVSPLNPTRPPLWSQVYTQNGMEWLTVSLAMYDSDLPTAQYLGVATITLDASFVSTQLAMTVSTSTAALSTFTSMEQSLMLIVETSSNVVIGTSEPGQLLRTSDPLGKDRLVTLDDYGTIDQRVQDIVNYFNATGASIADKDTWHFSIPSNIVQSTTIMSDRIQDNKKWVVMVVLPESVILGPIRDGSRTAQGIAGTLASMAVLISVAVAFLIAQSLDRLALDMTRLSQFEFNLVISNKSDKKSKLKNRSFILEVLILQQAFFELVRAFSRDLREAKKITVARQSSHTGSQGHSHGHTGSQGGTGPGPKSSTPDQSANSEGSTEKSGDFSSHFSR